GIDHQGAGEHLADRHDMIDQLAHGDEAVVRDAEEGVGDAGAGHIGRSEIAIRRHAGGERVGDTGQDQGCAGFEHGAELLAGGLWHRGQCAGTLAGPQGISTTEPVVLRASTSACAAAASRSGYSRLISILTLPLVTMPNRSLTVSSRSARVAV